MPWHHVISNLIFVCQNNLVNLTLFRHFISACDQFNQTWRSPGRTQSAQPHTEATLSEALVQCETWQKSKSTLQISLSSAVTWVRIRILLNGWMDGLSQKRTSLINCRPFAENVDVSAYRNSHLELDKLIRIVLVFLNGNCSFIHPTRTCWSSLFRVCRKGCVHLKGAETKK